MKSLREIYDYREMIFSLVRRDLRGRYKGSVLGFLWTFINPLFQLLVYTFVFGYILPNRMVDRYYLFLFVALIPWLFFSTSVSGGAGCIKAQKDMVNKIYFPRMVLPISYVTSMLVNMLLSFIVVVVVIFFSGIGFNFHAILYFPIIVIMEYILALGFALIASAITVFFRDMEYILGIVTMAWQFLTPVMYPMEYVPERIRPIYELNPMTPIINAYRDIFYYKQVPQLRTLVMGGVLSVALLVIGCIVFQHLQRHFSEEL